MGGGFFDEQTGQLVFRPPGRVVLETDKFVRGPSVCLTQFFWRSETSCPSKRGMKASPGSLSWTQGVGSLSSFVALVKVRVRQETSICLPCVGRMHSYKGSAFLKDVENVPVQLGSGLELTQLVTPWMLQLPRRYRASTAARSDGDVSLVLAPS